MNPEKQKPSSQNIFDIVSKKNMPSKEQEVPSAREEEKNSEDPKILWKKCQGMYHDIQKRLDALFSFTEVSSHQLSRFLSNPKNFTRGEWEQIQDARKTTEQRLADLKQKVGITEKEESKAPPSKQALGESSFFEKEQGGVVPSPKEMKKKKLMPRHRWLDMR